MKKHFLFAALAMTALFSACNNEDDNLKNENEGKKVTFVIGGVDSRTITSDTFETTFASTGDYVGITGDNIEGMTNISYTVTVDGSTTIEPTTSAEYVYGEGTTVFNAYYPYSANFDNTFTVGTDQNTDGTDKYDFLTATATGSSDDPQVTLNFKHSLVLIQVTLNDVTGVNYVTLKNAKTKVAYTASTDGETDPSVETQDTPVADITMKEKTTDQKFWAIVPAQTFTAGSLFEIVTDNGDRYIYTTSEKEITQGTIVKYNLTLKTTGDDEEPVAVLVDMQPVNIVAWAGQDTEAITGDIELYKWSLSNLYDANTTFTSGSVTGYSTTPKWFYQLSTAEIDTENIDNTDTYIIKMKAATETKLWYQNGIAFCGGANNLLKPGKTYKVSFYAKATASTTLRLWCGEKQDNTTAYIFRQTNDDNSTLRTFTLTTDWKLYEVSFDPSKTNSTANTSATFADNSTERPFNIVFWPGGTSTAAEEGTETEGVDLIYSIHSISIQEN